MNDLQIAVLAGGCFWGMQELIGKQVGVVSTRVGYAGGKVVTEVNPVGEFWAADSEHQNYLQRHPDGYTCHFPRPRWKLKPPH
ncbi:peptide-methionine (S)-S-oxide reductase [Nocardia sp. NPDC057272]|uniref:peptide-methionine (S)-S-oxide reductase n=1 Tax=Nocardia sp. NPDC057272 TaxID=3346079 RepID=UPI0036368802